MNVNKILFDSNNSFKVITVENHFDLINIYLKNNIKQGCCPNCELPSAKVHSYYTRKFLDLPVFGKSSNIYLKARKFYCQTPECPVRIFTERFKEHFHPYQRRTKRLNEKLLGVVIEAGGKPAERICRQFSIPISDSSLLRIIANKELPLSTDIVALGVDDWAIKKRERYGSILIDLMTNRPIGLLQGREERTFSTWLSERNSIRVISRDRYSNYQKASTQGAPDAIQVVDRWHLLKNLGEAVRKILDREYGAMKRVRDNNGEIKSSPPRIINSTASPRQLEKFTEVKKLLE
ncbi:MAG: ISL3 family transposase, partial [Sphingobacterium sp.]